MIRQDLNISTGKVLLASPFMDDPNFIRAAVLICSHNDHGTIGFVFNKPMFSSINDTLEFFPPFGVKIFKGGPVEMNTLHFLHSSGSILNDSIPVCPGIFWSGDFKMLKFLVKNDLIKPNDIRFFAGYTGWDKGQLEEEVNENVWIATNMDPNYLFKFSPDAVWKTMLKDKKEHYPPLADIPENFAWN